MSNISRLIIVFVLQLLLAPVYCQSRKMCGFVLDSLTHEPLIGASVYEDTGSRGVATDKNGFFCLEGKATSILQVSYIGYKSLRCQFASASDTLVTIYLPPGVYFDAVTVNANRNAVKDIDKLSIPIVHLKNIPSLSGEPDVLKAFQLMPGVQMGSEANSGLYVRGGEVDENLFLLDDVPLYYVNHLGGFMSVFDVNVIKDVNLYKGVFPARYGGRLSSVVDIRLKDGDVHKSKSEFMIGTFASKIYTEGSWGVENKTKYLFSLRRCNIDLLTRPLSLMSSDGQDLFAYTFYDAIGKITHTFDQRNKLVFMCYLGRDKLLLSNSSSSTSGIYTSSKDNTNTKSWGNQVLNVKWNHLFGNHIFNESSIGLTRFFYSDRSTSELTSQWTEFNSGGVYGASQLVSNKSTSAQLFKSSVNDYTFKNELKYMASQLQIYVGGQMVLHHFIPKIRDEEYSNNKTRVAELSRTSHWEPEVALYVDGNWDATKKLNVQSGLYFMYWPGIQKQSIDPRLKLRYQLGTHLYVNAGYAVTNQYVHLLSTTNGGVPSELWIPSSEDVLPKRAKQYSSGLLFDKAGWQYSAEVYYKELTNLIAINPTLSLMNSVSWSDFVTAGGVGVMKGAEFLVEKKRGRYTGWLGYTLSDNQRQYDGLNYGQPFPFKYDRRHEVKTSVSFAISSAKSLSFTWVYHSGNPITMARQKYPAIDFDLNSSYKNVSLSEAHYYDGINSYRIEPYHRLDMGYTATKKIKSTIRTLYLGVYNVYNKRNPYYLYFQEKNNEVKLFKYTLFPILPSISYSVAF